jgi:putative transposase
VQDRDGAKLLLSGLGESQPYLVWIWADGAYAGQLEQWAEQGGAGQPIELQIVKRSDSGSGFQVLPRRWVVERTLAWLGRWRRLSKDYEVLPKSTEAFIYLAMTYLMLRRLADGAF